MGFDIGQKKKAYFYKDTLHIRLNAGFLGGYNLKLRMVEDDYKAILTAYDCTWQKDLRIIKQNLQLENFNLLNSAIVKGKYFCEALPNNNFSHNLDKVIVLSLIHI